MMDKTERVKNYIRQAIRCPCEGISQVTSMVILHFDIPDKEADLLVLDVLRQLFEPKPDESRLLAELTVDDCLKIYEEEGLIKLVETVRDLAASIVRAECEAKIESKLYEIVHSRTKQVAYDKVVKLWQSLKSRSKKEGKCQ